MRSIACISASTPRIARRTWLIVVVSPLVMQAVNRRVNDANWSAAWRARAQQPRSALKESEC